MSNPLTNRGAFQGVFEEYYSPLCNFVNQYIRNWESSEEIVQSTFVKLWENREKIAIKSSIQSYLYQSAKNSTIDYIRKRKTETKKKAEILHMSKDDTYEMSTYDESYRIKQKIMLALDKIKPKYREVFKLNKLEGLTYDEIADYLKISKRTVEYNMARALESLCGLLKDKV